jgi:hypothetical protein
MSRRGRLALLLYLLALAALPAIAQTPPKGRWVVALSKPSP